MATHFPIWRQASQRRDSRENLITFCIQLVPNSYAVQEMAGWRNKKGKSGSVATLSSSKMAQRARREYYPRVNPLQRYNDQKFRRRYRLDKKSVIEIAEDFGRSQFATKGTRHSGGLSHGERVGHYVHMGKSV